MSVQITAARQELWARTVFDAILVLRAAMRDPNTPEAREAAVEVIRLETCRMRHAGTISGTAEGEPYSAPPPVAEPAPAASPSITRDKYPDLRARWAERGLAGLYDLLPLPPDLIPAEYPNWGLTPDGLPGPELLAQLGLPADALDDEPADTHHDDQSADISTFSPSAAYANCTSPMPGNGVRERIGRSCAASGGAPPGPPRKGHPCPASTRPLSCPTRPASPRMSPSGRSPSSTARLRSAPAAPSARTFT